MENHMFNIHWARDCPFGCIGLFVGHVAGTRDGEWQTGLTSDECIGFCAAASGDAHEKMNIAHIFG